MKKIASIQTLEAPTSIVLPRKNVSGESGAASSRSISLPINRLPILVTADDKSTRRKSAPNVPPSKDVETSELPDAARHSAIVVLQQTKRPAIKSRVTTAVRRSAKALLLRRNKRFLRAKSFGCKRTGTV
jgi:hypothetical protein